MKYIVWEQTVSSDWTFKVLDNFIEAQKYINTELVGGRLKNDGYCITIYIGSNFPDWFGEEEN